MGLRCSRTSNCKSLHEAAYDYMHTDSQTLQLLILVKKETKNSNGSNTTTSNNHQNDLHNNKVVMETCT